MKVKEGFVMSTVPDPTIMAELEEKARVKEIEKAKN